VSCGNVACDSNVKPPISWEAANGLEFSSQTS